MAGARDLDSLARQLRGESSWRASLLLLLILAFLLAAGTWAALTEIDDVTRADGRIVPSRDLQLVQATEAGVLKAIHVREGELVEAGAVLMELDSSVLSGQLGQEQQRAYGLMARIERLEAEIGGTGLGFSAALITAAPAVVRSETALYHGRQAALQAQIDILESRRRQRREELAEGQTDLVTAEASLAIAAEEMAMMAPLVERRIEPETTLLALRRTTAELGGRRLRAEAALARLQSALEEIDDQVAAERARQRAEALDHLALATAELGALEPMLPALESRAERSTLRAPVRGVVNRIHRSTIGGLAHAGEDLLELVPLGDGLRVEAYVRPSDIAFLHAGQKVKVKITAYDFARYGALDGEITRIGADAVERPDQPGERAFVIEVRTEGTMLDAGGLQVEIIPGMVTEVDILSGRKTVLDYLTRPVMRVKERALRE